MLVYYYGLHSSKSTSNNRATGADHVTGHWSAYPIQTGHSHLIISDNHGKDWRVGKHSLALNTSNECSIAELSNGTLVMNV